MLSLSGRGWSSLVVVACALGAPARLSAQRYSFQQLGSDLGLKNQHVQVLHQDRAGFIWAATRNGLYRFDGYSFSVFDQRRGLPSADVVAVAETPEGALFAATTKGLARRVGEHFELASTSSVAFETEALAADGYGNLYAATRSGLAVARVTASGSLDFRLLSGQPSTSVVSGIDGVWFSCGSSVCAYKRGRVSVEKGLPPASYRALRFDHQGKLWARSEDGLFVLDGTFRRVAADRAYRTAPLLYGDRAGGVWTNSSDGVSRNGVRWGLTQGLSSEGVTAILEDNEGSLWFGFDGAGIQRKLGGEGVVSFTRSEGLSDDSVQTVAGDGAGGVWVGHATSRLDHGIPSAGGSWNWKSYDLPAQDVTFMRRLTSGALIVLTRSGPVLSFDGSTARVLAGPAGRALRVLDDEGNIAYADGIYHGTDRKAAYPEGVVALDALKDRNGRIWVAHLGGLTVQEGSKWQRFTHTDNLLPGGVAHLVEGPDGDIWLSYRESAGVGRLRLDSGKAKDTMDLTHFRGGRGPVSDLVQSLSVDSLGRVWVGTDRGAALYDGKTWRNFGVEQGLVWNDVSFSASGSGARGPLWIGTRRGLTLLRTPVQDSIDPPIRAVISSVDQSSRFLGTDTPIKLRGQSDSITIRYSALRYVDANAMEYRYRVRGLGDEWIETAVHQVTLSYLRPGAYTFEVQAKPPGGTYSGLTAELDFTVAESWMLSPWFRIGSLLAATALFAWLLYRRRMSRLEGERQALETAVADRTAELEMQKTQVEQEKAKADRQNREIERLLDEAKQASRLKGEFLANMSHEIRTPMNGIIGMINLALATPLGGDQRDFVETAKNSAESLLSILNDVLDFSKIEAGHLTVDPAPFAVRELLSDTCKVFQPKAVEKEIQLSFEVAGNVPRSVVSDPGRVRQVLLNLIGNAIKFTHHGHVRVSVVLQSELLRFTVEDTGIGISADKLKVVFEAFRQADGSTTRRYGGTGLGLAISMKLASLMGGNLWVESEQGNGSKFHFTVAAGSQAAADEEPVVSSQDLWRMNKVLARADAPAGRTLRILLAEDNLVNQRVASRMLGMRGHAVKVVENGAEALQALDRGELFDLILMDVQMPQMDGIEATRLIRVREEVHGGHIRIVAMTAHTMTGDRERCLAAGMDDYVNKPIDPVTFFKAVEGAATEVRLDGTVSRH